MKKLIISACFAVSMLTVHAQLKDNITGRYEVKKLYSYAIQEDVKTILQLLDSLPADAPDSIKNLKGKYMSRFRYKNEKFDYGSTDPFIKEAIDIYRNYWTPYLMKERTIELSDSLLDKQLSSWLGKYKKESDWNESKITTDTKLYFSHLLNLKGYFNNVDGKTGNPYDIYIWKRQDTINYNVSLPDGNISVPVIFMKDIITLGWEEYATFGVSFPGGWPKDSSLYCVAKAYDTANEKFTVHYLLHEAQHFFDMKYFKEVSPWMLEYRAKLAELSKSKEHLYKLLKSFQRGAKDGDSSLTHPYAEFCVLRDLGGVISQLYPGIDLSKGWEDVKAEVINSTATMLLRKHTEKVMIKKN